MAKKTLFIHPNDRTTDVLKCIYENQPDWTIINFLEDFMPPDDNVSFQIFPRFDRRGLRDLSNTTLALQKVIDAHDRIIMMGHGTPMGLLGFRGHVINVDLVQNLRQKECVFMWCNADSFVNPNRLKGFNTGMIISEMSEAAFCGVNCTEEELEYSNVLFAEALRDSMHLSDRPKEMRDSVIKLYTPMEEYSDSELFNFNLSRIYYT